MTHDEALKSRLTGEFLDTLLEAAKCEGWNHDYVEVRWFVQALFTRAGRKPPTELELEPYE